VHLITSRREAGGGWKVTKEAGITVHWIPVAYDNRMGFAQRLAAFVRFAMLSATRASSIPCDVVFATSTPLTVVLPGFIASLLRRVPLVFEVRDLWPEVPIAMGVLRNPAAIFAARLLERLAYKWSTHIVAAAPGMREDIIASGIHPAKVTVITNGCDREIFAADLGNEARRLREQHLWLGGRKLVLYGGSLGRVNGAEYLVDVAAELALVDPEIRMVVVGDGAEREAVISKARQLGVLDKSFFIFPLMPKRELAAWLAACDLALCMITGPRVVWKDAVQNKFFDALAAGKPTACNFDGFQSELAVKHNVGIVFPPNDAAQSAQLIRRTLSDTAWLSEVRERSEVLARTEFDRVLLAGRLEAVLLHSVRVGI